MIYKTAKHLFVITLALVSILNASAENSIAINDEFLNQFKGFAIKKMTATDAGENKTNMSEFHGIKRFSSLLGTDDKKYYKAKFYYLSNNDFQEYDKQVTWYVTGKGKSWQEHRLYYGTGNPILKKAKADDLLLIGKVDSENLKIFVFDKSTDEKQELLNSLYLSINDVEYQETTKIYKDKDSQKIVVIGKVSKVYDGDTFILDDLFKVRMVGIDTPEKRQVCQNKKGKDYKCGETSKQHLLKLLGKRKVTCQMNGWGAYNRHLFTCKNSKGIDINQQMVRDGYAVMSTYKPFRYKKDEQYAKDHKLALWSGDFMHPREFRKK